MTAPPAINKLSTTESLKLPILYLNACQHLALLSRWKMSRKQWAQTIQSQKMKKKLTLLIKPKMAALTQLRVSKVKKNLNSEVTLINQSI
jgi:hypothetical protein